MIEWVESLF